MCPGSISTNITNGAIANMKYGGKLTMAKSIPMHFSNNGNLFLLELGTPRIAASWQILAALIAPLLYHVVSVVLRCAYEYMLGIYTINVVAFMTCQKIVGDARGVRNFITCPMSSHVICLMPKCAIASLGINSGHPFPAFIRTNAIGEFYLRPESCNIFWGILNHGFGSFQPEGQRRVQPRGWRFDFLNYTSLLNGALWV